MHFLWFIPQLQTNNEMEYRRLPPEIWTQILSCPTLTYIDICRCAESCRDARWGIPTKRISTAKTAHIKWTHPSPIKVCVEREPSLLGEVIKIGRTTTFVARTSRRSKLSVSSWLNMTISEVAAIARNDSFSVDVESDDGSEIVVQFLRARKFLHAFVFVTLHPSVRASAVRNWIRSGCSFIVRVMQCGIDAYIFLRCALAKSRAEDMIGDIDLLPLSGWSDATARKFTLSFPSIVNPKNATVSQGTVPLYSDLENVIESQNLLDMFRWACFRGTEMRLQESKYNSHFLSYGWIEGLCCFGILERPWSHMRNPLNPHIKNLSPDTSHEGIVTVLVMAGFSPSVIGSTPSYTPVSPLKIARFAKHVDQAMLDWITFYGTTDDDIWQFVFELIVHRNYVAFQQLWLKIQPIRVPESRVAQLLSLVDAMNADAGTRDIIMSMLMMVE